MLATAPRGVGGAEREMEVLMPAIRNDGFEETRISHQAHQGSLINNIFPKRFQTSKTSKKQQQQQQPPQSEAEVLGKLGRPFDRLEPSYVSFL